MKTILLIEDNASMRRNIAEMLTFEGFGVQSAADGETGLRLVRENKPDLILCDIMMPGMDGYAVLSKLRAEPATASIPLIFMTAKGDMTDLRLGMSLGADDYLPKPVTRIDLLDAIQVRLQRRAEQSAAPLRFDDAAPLEKLGISSREAEVLLWMAQGKSNSDIAVICDISIGTVKKHALHIFEKLRVEGRTSASLRAIEILSGKA